VCVYVGGWVGGWVCGCVCARARVRVCVCVCACVWVWVSGWVGVVGESVRVGVHLQRVSVNGRGCVGMYVSECLRVCVGM
jgi:hypothetical protein